MAAIIGDILLGLFLLVVVGVLAVIVGVYLQDRAGWHATLGRASKIIRSFLGGAADQIESRSQRRSEMKGQWEQEFEAVTKPEAEAPKHRVVKRDYVGSGRDEKARCVCSCGTDYSYYISIYGIHGSRFKALNDINEHVERYNKIENRGNFKW